MKNQISMNLPATTKEADQILIVDGQDNLRFARVDEMRPLPTPTCLKMFSTKSFKKKGKYFNNFMK